jgi:hypothetical protein
MNASDTAPSRLDCQLRIRLTEAERLALENDAREAGMTLSDLVRSRVLKGSRAPVRGRTQAPAFQSMSPAMFAQLSRIGNNLNQLARAFNSGQDVNRAEIMRKVAEVWQVMMQDEVAARYAQSAEAKIAQPKGLTP